MSAAALDAECSGFLSAEPMDKKEKYMDYLLIRLAAGGVKHSNTTDSIYYFIDNNLNVEQRPIDEATDGRM